MEDSPAEEMPGVIRTDLPIQDNSDMVEDNIKTTGVNDPIDSYDYIEEPKVDLNIDPPTNPILPENPTEQIDDTVPTFETTIKKNLSSAGAALEVAPKSRKANLLNCLLCSFFAQCAATLLGGIPFPIANRALSMLARASACGSSCSSSCSLTRQVSGNQ